MAISLKHAQAHRGARPVRACAARCGVARRSPAPPERPRLVVTRSAKHISVQVVDDLAGHTLVWASTMEADVRAVSGDKTAKATKVGELVAERAKAAGIETVVFDRAGNKYHGRIAALADGAREGGLTF